VIKDTTDENGTLHQLKYPFKLVFRKSPTRILYPVYYIQTVNAAPWEEIKYRGIDLFGYGCRAGEYDPDPTCGWALDASGHAIPYSQVCPSLLFIFFFFGNEERIGVKCQITIRTHSSSPFFKTIIHTTQPCLID
jgi:hypothetical protein